MDYPQQTDPVLSAGLDIQFAINGVKSSVDKLCELNGTKLYLPQRIPLKNVGQVVSGTPLVIDLGAPPHGHEWLLRQAVVSDASVINTNITGVTDIHLYTGQPGSFIANGLTGSAGDVVWGPMTQGTVYGLSSEYVQVIAGDHLFAVVIGATSTGQTVQVKVEALQYIPGSGRQVFAL